MSIGERRGGLRVSPQESGVMAAWKVSVPRQQFLDLTFTYSAYPQGPQSLEGVVASAKLLHAISSLFTFRRILVLYKTNFIVIECL